MLAATSEYFRAMLRVYMKEKNDDEVDLGGISASSLEKIIDFIYTGSMQLSFNTLIDILNTANHLQIPTVLNLCSEYIISKITFSNAEEFIQIADIYSLTKVMDHFNERLLKQFDSFACTPFFLSTPFETFKTYLEDNRLKTSAEYNLINYISEWLKEDNTRLEHVLDLMKCVRVGLIAKTSLQQGHHLLTLAPDLKEVFEAGLSFHENLLTHHPTSHLSNQLRSDTKSLVLIFYNSTPRPFEIVAYEAATSKYYRLSGDSYACRDCRVAEVDNFLYIFRVVDSGGGTNVNSLVRFDPRHLSLVVLSPCRHVRMDTVIIPHDFKIYCFGGLIDLPQENSGITIIKMVDVYDVFTNSWSDLPALPEATYGHAGCVLDGLIYLSGGVTPGSNNQAVDNMVEYNPHLNTYTTKQSMYFPRRLHEMEALKEHLYVLGGIGYHSFDQQKNKIAIERYSVAENQWTCLSSTLAGRSVGHFIVFNHAIVSLGREHRRAKEDDVWSYEADEGRWTPLAKAPSRMSLVLVDATLMHVNFDDERVAKRIFTDKW